MITIRPFYFTFLQRREVPYRGVPYRGVPTNITTIIKALIFIIIIIQQQSYQWVAGHDGQYNCHAFTFWGSGTTVTGITNTNVKSPQCLLMIRILLLRIII